ncbi:MAG: nicotinamide-nucleotide adenylyltransferase [Methanobacteriota archaeon]|nr:MAG: nicotinamide-nucleotide adenylyltransferase [Euryarchaeota archaeon]
MFVGRFQPFHNGHLFMVRKILEDLDRVIIGIGSAQHSHTPRNPYTSSERQSMIERALEGENIRSYEIVLIEDVGEHSLWVPYVESLVPRFGVIFSNDPLTVRLFREKGYEVRELPLERREEYSGTELRRRMSSGEDWEHLVPDAVADYISELYGIERIVGVS